MIRFAATRVVSGHVPRVFANEEARHVRVGHGLDVRVVGHGHSPLVQGLVVLDDRVLLTDVAQKTWSQNHVRYCSCLGEK